MLSIDTKLSRRKCMRYIFVFAAITFFFILPGCDEADGPLDSDLVDRLAGSWTGILDHTLSGGAAIPMVLTLTDVNNYWLTALLTTSEGVYEDDFVVEVGDNIVMNFAVAGVAWELVLEGKLSDSTFGGDMIRREAGEDDIILGTWMASPS
jgi:hypothetical protein